MNSSACLCWTSVWPLRGSGEGWMRGSDCRVGWQIVSYTCKQAWSACDPCSRQTPCLHGEWHRTSPPVESPRCILRWILRSDSAPFIKFVLREIRDCFCCGNNHQFFSVLSWLHSGVDTEVKDLTNEVILIMTTAPQGFFCSQHHKYQEAMAVIDSLMTELCKSFNPFIRLNRGHLMHFTPAPLPIWLL